MAVSVETEPEPEGAAEYFGDAVWTLLKDYARILVSEGIDQGVIGPHEAARIFDRHILNSTALNTYIPDGSQVIDVGSGGGLPGLVIAITRPDVSMSLVEPLQRRSDFLTRTIHALGLSNVSVYRARSEDLFGKMLAPIVTARGVSALHSLLGMTMPLVAPQGSLLALKGFRAGKEIDNAARELKKSGALWADVYEERVFASTQPTYVVEVRKK
ncbi:MAG: 16S rRNA (guanine(527)-N(7))-methyltransferase RsmG [Actinomycetaceae bacterium]|nr:16S rRNA (guanine(527)-N(7))-methyltransferase RsmG [Actinomycetaceae bacterium]MDY6082443.1 16S rRNA (guanine(527)-N(7))-methyltransferase RsmG [Actinomycetaceae bacterium]